MVVYVYGLSLDNWIKLNYNVRRNTIVYFIRVIHRQGSCMGFSVGACGLVRGGRGWTLAGHERGGRGEARIFQAFSRSGNLVSLVT